MVPSSHAIATQIGSIATQRGTDRIGTRTSITLSLREREWRPHPNQRAVQEGSRPRLRRKHQLRPRQPQTLLRSRPDLAHARAARKDQPQQLPQGADTRPVLADAPSRSDTLNP